MFFYPLKASIILKQLQKKVGIFEAKILGDAEKGAPRDPIAETALRDIESLRDALTQGIEHFFQFSFYVSTYAKSEQELEKYTETHICIPIHNSLKDDDVKHIINSVREGR